MKQCRWKQQASNPPRTGVDVQRWRIQTTATRHQSEQEGLMAAENEMRIVLQVGNEMRVTNKGEVIVSNPELELAAEDRAADAVLFYRFNPNSGEHVFRLAEPVANHKHMKVHRAND
jgi:hypothetical protein